MRALRRPRAAHPVQLTRFRHRRAIAAQCVPDTRTKLKLNTELLQAGDDSKAGGTYGPAVAYNEVHCQTKTGAPQSSERSSLSCAAAPDTSCGVSRAAAD